MHETPEAHVVLYRKYRPKDFSEIVGQAHVVKPITNAIRLGKIAHAYLFSGPRGIGKTTIARLIAKSANCVGTVKPCNACAPCIAFNEGRALDVIEIDGASNRGIDEIRELREAVRFSASGGNKKVYIIDEVHMLTKEAFNALLKTLEEPPSHVIFVLATTELDKVLPTIISRTQHYDFHRPSAHEIALRLKHLASQEGVSLDDHAAESIAFIADGSLRDAESTFGKILAVGEKKITEEEVNEILGIPRRAFLRSMLENIIAGNREHSLSLISDLAKEGYDYTFALKMLIHYFRAMLLLRIDQSLETIILREMPSEDVHFLKNQPNTFTDHQISHALTVLIDALTNFKKSPIPQLSLELAALDIIAAGEKK